MYKLAFPAVRWELGVLTRLHVLLCIYTCVYTCTPFARYIKTSNLNGFYGVSVRVVVAAAVAAEAEALVTAVGLWGRGDYPRATQVAFVNSQCVDLKKKKRKKEKKEKFRRLDDTAKTAN